MRIRFTSADGVHIFVEVPWERHSGKIPPPNITFWHSQTDRPLTFQYNPE